MSPFCHSFGRAAKILWSRAAPQRPGVWPFPTSLDTADAALSSQKDGAFLLENKVWPTFPERDTLSPREPEVEVPPCAIPSESLAGRGFCKKCLQNLDVKDLRGQNFENKEVRTT